MEQSQLASRVLVVEDEPLIREMTSELIEEAGFEVVAAATAEQAIGVLEQSPDFLIVFSDVNMPGSIDGLWLAQYIRGRWPDMKVVLTSARPPEPRRLPGGVSFIRKPYSLDGLAAAFRDLAARPAA